MSASTAAAADDIFSESRTVLNSAACSGGEDVFSAVLTELENIWPAWRVSTWLWRFAAGWFYLRAAGNCVVEEAKCVCALYERAT